MSYYTPPMKAMTMHSSLHSEATVIKRLRSHLIILRLTALYSLSLSLLQWLGASFDDG